MCHCHAPPSRTSTPSPEPSDRAVFHRSRHTPSHLDSIGRYEHFAIARTPYPGVEWFRAVHSIDATVLPSRAVPNDSPRLRCGVSSPRSRLLFFCHYCVRGLLTRYKPSIEPNVRPCDVTVCTVFCNVMLTHVSQLFQARVSFQLPWHVERQLPARGVDWPQFRSWSISSLTGNYLQLYLDLLRSRSEPGLSLRLLTLVSSLGCSLSLPGSLPCR